MKYSIVTALVGAFNQENALVGAFSVIVQPFYSTSINTSPVDWPHDHYRTITISAEKCQRRFYMSIL